MLTLILYFIFCLWFRQFLLSLIIFIFHLTINTHENSCGISFTYKCHTYYQHFDCLEPYLYNGFLDIVQKKFENRINEVKKNWKKRKKEKEKYIYFLKKYLWILLSNETFICYKKTIHIRHTFFFKHLIFLFYYYYYYLGFFVYSICTAFFKKFTSDYFHQLNSEVEE